MSVTNAIIKAANNTESNMIVSIHSVSIPSETPHAE